VPEARIRRHEAAKEAAMRVERIYTRSIVGVTRSSTIQEAAALMRKHHVGTLLVMGDDPDVNTVLGFITDRDIVLQAVADGLYPDEVTAGEVMTPCVATVREDEDVHEALEAMRRAGIRRLVVMGTDGSIAGILSIDDIIDGLAADISKLAELLRRERMRESVEFEGIQAAA
jgi:CBS domain-containing protein